MAYPQVHRPGELQLTRIGLWTLWVSHDALRYYLIWFFGLSGAATWAFVIFVIANICLQLWNQEK